MEAHNVEKVEDAITSLLNGFVEREKCSSSEMNEHSEKWMRLSGIQFELIGKHRGIVN